MRVDAATDARPMTVWRALRGNPVRFLLSSWPWRALAYLITGPFVGLIWILFAVVLTVFGVLLAPLVIGIGLLMCVPLWAIALAGVERRRLRWLDPRPAPSPHAPFAVAGLRQAVSFRLREVATWREFGYAVLQSLLGVVQLGVVFVVLTGAYLYPPEIVSPSNSWQQGLPVMLMRLLFAILGVYLLTVIAGALAALSRLLLVRSPDQELGERLVAVTASRARIADAFEAERRRIERDLHDGAQQRLTGLIMRLGLARLDGDRDMLGEAQDEARAVLDDLRDLVRGIHPSVLTDRGLRAAVESLAERSPVPVEVDIDLPVRPPQAVETAAYFVIAEALANVAKHSGATRARVFVRAPGEPVVIEIRDDGAGGGDPTRGTGLQGLADRVAIYDGTVEVFSPHGGPTILVVEIPCGS